MWTEESLEKDLEAIKKKDFKSVTALSSETPTDEFLLQRYNFIKLLYTFKNNDFDNLKKLSNEYLPGCIEYLDNFNLSQLSETIPSPTFDHMLLTFMTSATNAPNYSLFMKLFHHYKAIINELNGREEGSTVKLNDRTLSGEVSATVRTALDVIQGRIDYLSELIVSSLYSSGLHQLLITFLEDFCLPSTIDNDTTLSQLGRAALACGNNALALNYFEAVKSENFKLANQGYINYFSNLFQNAKKDFTDAKTPAAPSNLEACNQHMGQFTSDPTESPVPNKKLTAEDKTQWPNPPRV